MIARTKQSWRHFEASKPGHRFQERYRRRQEREGGWRDFSKLFFLVGGLVIAVGSLLLGVLPGPGTLTFFVGLGMIAGEFRPIARLLDWAEVRARELGRWVGGVWRSSAAGKASVVAAAAICAAAVLYAAYRLLFGGYYPKAAKASTMHKEDTHSTRGHTLERGGAGAHWVGCAGVPGGTR